MLAQIVLNLVLLVFGSGTALGANHAITAVAPASAVVATTTQASAAQPLQLLVDGDLQPFDVFAIYVLPGETVRLSSADASTLALRASDGTLEDGPDGVWSWTAPARTGVERLDARGPGGDVRVNAFVMAPAATVQGGRLNGYPIGIYPASTGRSPAYLAPRGFIEVTPQNADVQVSPHFRVGQFLCKADAGYPKYLALSPRLVQKLELMLAEVNRRGYDVETFHVMSGYRTPAYNHGLGNVKLSRHQYGDAADIYIDKDGDGQMDDLNHDGRSNVRDSRLLYNIIEELSARPELQRYVGGMGFYDGTHAHGPFVHVDARGYKARWEG